MSDIRYNGWLHRSGTGGVYQDSSGRVGIGSSTPDQILECSQATGTTLIKAAVAGNSRVGFEIEKTGATTQTWRIQDGQSNNGILEFYDQTDSRSVMVLNGSGHVGVTSASPVATRFSGTVSGLINLAGTKPCVYISETDSKDSSGTNRALYMGLASGTAYAGSNAPFSFATGDTTTTERVRIDTAGNVNITGVCTAATFVPTEGQLGNRNIIVNGDMQIAQRNVSSNSVGYNTIDRMYGNFAGTDEAPTFAQVDVTADTPAWNAGFRKAFRVTNGNQTGGAGAADELNMIYNVEAQDIAQSGWDYTSSSSNITLSFWVKSSVAQDFQVNMRLYPPSGDQKELCFAYSATTSWTRITKVIPGAAGNVLRNTNELGMFIQMPMYYGTNYTANSRPYDTWETKNNAQNYKDFTTTWYTTNDATWEMTGLQLEVGSAATPFEHRSTGDQLRACERYFQSSFKPGHYPSTSTSANGTINVVSWADGNAAGLTFRTPMRGSPTVTLRNPLSTTANRVDSSGTERVAAATNIGTTQFKFINITSGSANTWVNVGYFAESEL